MRVVLFRHGIAIRRDDPRCPASDDERALTERGRARTAASARGLGTLLPGPVDVIVTSPLLRTRQTAAILRDELELPPSAIIVSEHLAPSVEADEIAALLSSSMQDALAVVVGHAPNLDELLAFLLDWPRPFTRLKKASAAFIDEGELVWALPPRALRQLGR